MTPSAPLARPDERGRVHQPRCPLGRHAAVRVRGGRNIPMHRTGRTLPCAAVIERRAVEAAIRVALSRADIASVERGQGIAAGLVLAPPRRTRRIGRPA